MKRLFPFIIILFISLSSCTHDRLDVDVSAITVPQLKILHYEKDFFAIDTSNLEGSLSKLKSKYGEFSDGFINNIIAPSARDSFAYFFQICSFILDKDMKDVNEECGKLFPSEHFSQMENEITDAFKHFKYYFPKRKLPIALHTVVSGFSNNIFNV